MYNTEWEANLRSAFLEHFEGIDNEDGERDEDYEPPMYWQDEISELADSAVPIYTTDLVKLWLDLGCPEIDDTGLIEGVTDVTRIIGMVIYEQASQFLYELVTEFKLDD